MKYRIDYTSKFKKQYKRLIKQGKNISKMLKVVELLANGNKIDIKYRNHQLINDKYYANCYECHIEPDWLLVYRIDEKDLIMVLIETGSHSEILGK